MNRRELAAIDAMYRTSAAHGRIGEALRARDWEAAEAALSDAAAAMRELADIEEAKAKIRDEQHEARMSEFTVDED
jgi:hypothetical protein